MSELRLNKVTDKDTDKGVNVDALHYQNTQLVRSLGPWKPGLVFENKTDYATYNDQAIITSGGATLPYTTQGSDPTDGPDAGNVVPFAVDGGYVNQAQEELISGKIFPESGAVKNGYTVPAGTTHLRVLVGGETTIVKMSPVSSGVVSLLTETNATIGVTPVILYSEIESINSVSDIKKQPQQSLQNFIDDVSASFQDGKILEDVTISTPVTISESVTLCGGQKNKGDKPTLIPDTGQSGLSVDKTFVAGVDENMPGVALKRFNIIEQTQSKTSSTVGLLYNRVNKGGRIEEVEVRGFEKGINLKGVIGGVLDNAHATNNTYGLYTESNNDAGLAGYDCTNTVFMHGVFNANDYGVYLDAITQGLSFFGTNIERNNIVGVDIAATPPASSAINFFGAWFEGNPIATRFTEKVNTVQYYGCYFFDNVELWDNAGSGVIDATYEKCRIDSSHIDLDIFRGKFVDNDVTNCTFTATSPNAYRCKEWSGTPVTVDDGNTLYRTKIISGDMYEVDANGGPSAPTSTLADGSKWYDTNKKVNYIKIGGVWQEVESYIIDERTVDFGSISAGGSASFGPVTVLGASVGDFAEVTPNGNLQGLVFQVHVSAANQVSGTVYNFTTGAVDLPSMSYRIRIKKA